MRRLSRSLAPLVPVLLLAACTDAPQSASSPIVGPRSVLEPPALGDPLAGLTGAQLQAFTRGKQVFVREFTQLSGLGPIFNVRSCSGCHGGEDGGVVGGADPIDFETHFSRVAADGSCSQLVNRGGFVHQDSATTHLTNLTGITTERFPSVPFDSGFRSTPDLFGFGLIDAIPDAQLLANADPNDADGDGISGRVSYVGTAIGRFGRKANDNDLDHFNAGAMLNEIGITNSVFMAENNIGGLVIGGDSIPASVDPATEPELSGGDLDDLDAFVRFLAPPPARVPSTAEELQGQALFTSAGCTKCHTPEFTTGPNSVAALSGQTVRPFSDFLLHDMGPELADICLGNAVKSEFRTEPLMGARFMEVFLHDGRAHNIGQAIFQHGGEALNARNAYVNMSGTERLALIAYIKTL
jgi:CxxC motif-containing protein (DUF1111 family)